jgi:hypothetical protein
MLALASVAIAVDTDHTTNLRKHHPTAAGAEGMVKTMNTAKTGSHGPVVVDKRFCATILVSLEAKEAPYWDKEGGDGDGCCQEDRPDLLAQCDKILVGFLEKVSELCPSIDPPADDDFKKIKYVPDITKAVTASQHVTEKKPTEPDCPDPCAVDIDDGCDCEADDKKPLKRTPDGKPVKDWAAPPNAPSKKVDDHILQAQEECPSPPCDASDYKTMKPAPEVFESEEQAAAAAEAGEEEATGPAEVEPAAEATGPAEAEPAEATGPAAY